MDPLIVNNVREREDLASVIDMLMLKDDDLKYFSFVRFLGSIAKVFGSKVSAQKHEWIEDSARAESISVQASGDGLNWDTTNDITDLPVVTAECNKLRVGDMLLLDQDEVVVVKAIDTGAQTIDLVARGHGSTTAAVLDHATAHTCQIIGNAQVEDADPLDPNYVAQTENYNYTQIFEDVAQISGTLRRSKTVGGDHLDYQVVKKLKELLRLLNRCISEGIRNLDTTNKISTMGGLREFITSTSNVAGSITKAKIYAGVVAHIDAGLYPSAIHASPSVIGDIEQLYEASISTTPDTKGFGTKITTITVLGYTIELHPDKHVRSSEALLLDYNRIAFGYLEGGVKGQDGKFSVYDILENGKQVAKQVLGEYTLHVANGGGTRFYGIT